MSNGPVIRVEGLGKKYRIQHQPEQRQYVALRDVLAEKARGVLKVLKAGGGTRTASPGLNRATREDFWALKDVSFEITKGEVVGIIGRNGAGKSTLLKIFSRITEPTTGTVRLRGRVASLLEVGTGFHGELTGRENIFLNGAILGMHRQEIKRKFDEIVAFAEIGKFLDTPVKRYSSGMYVRLAFAVAAHLEPEILIVDEVLSVGDASFQAKSMGKMRDQAGKGRTILFVSHNMEAVRNLCQRAIWMKDGVLHRDGMPDDIIKSYFRSISNEPSSASSNQVYGLVIQKVVLKNVQGGETGEFHPGEDLIVEIHYHAQACLKKPYVTLGIIGINGPCFTANMRLDGARPEALDGTGTIVCRFESIPLLPQTYAVNLGIHAKNGDDVIIEYHKVASFRVVAELADYGYKGEFQERASRYTSVVVPYEWRLPDGTSVSISLGKGAVL
jgi:lipopolysaccharide transport system ATP-binding protein